MTFYLALGAAILSALSIVLHVVAPRTKSTIDDKLLGYVDAAKDKLSGN
jgi:hypothetical protein